MSQIIYPITHLPPVIDIGKQTEMGVTRIGFDVHEWLDDWPGMVFSVQPTRPGETESYLAASEMVGSVVFWLVGAVDTEKPGSGTVEVLGVTEDERKLSFMCRTSIANTNTATTAEIPEPDRPWVDKVILAGESAKADAKEAKESAESAENSAADAAQSADEAAKSAATISGASAPLKQLVTDADGKVAWEDRLAYKYSTESTVVNLAETALTPMGDEGFALLTPWAANLVAGTMCTVTYNGADYECKAIDIHVIQPDYLFDGCTLGNFDAMGVTGIDGSNTDAPFVMIALANDSADGAYAELIPLDGAESVTLAVSYSDVKTDIKKVDRELLDVPTPDMQAGEGEDGYIKNRPCWVYETPKGRVWWDGVIEGKEALYATANGETTLLGYKVCPVPMNEHTFANKLNSYCYAYPVNEDGSSAGTKRIIDTREYVTAGLHAIKQNTGKVLYYSYDADSAGDSLFAFSGGSSGIYITPEFIAEAAAPCIEWVTGNIYKPLTENMLPPATTRAENTNAYYWRWSPSSNAWQAVTIDQLKTDLDMTGTDGGTAAEDALYVATVSDLQSDRTASEIRAAVADGKVCVLIDDDGRLFTYYGETEDALSGSGQICPTFVSAGKHEKGVGVAFKRALVMQGGQVSFVESTFSEHEDTSPLIVEASAWMNPEETAWIVTAPNKSVAEIIAAFKAGRDACAHVRIPGETMAGDFAVLPLVKVQGSTAVVFGASAPGLSAKLEMVNGEEATFEMTTE